MLNDKTYRLTFASDQFRLFAADTTTIAQQLRDTHDLTPLPTIMMARMATAAALIAMDIKQEYGEVTLRIDSDSDLRGGIVIINSHGRLKGYCNNPSLVLPDLQDNFNVAKHLKPGVLSVIRQDNEQRQFTGIVDLENGDIGADIANYYMQSEQIPTAVNLGVLIDPNAVVRASGGFLIQQLPQADLALSDEIIRRIAATPNISDLMDMGMTIPDILHKFIIKDFDHSNILTREIEFACNCSKDRFADALCLLGEEELRTLTDGIEPVCHYCNKQYVFSRDEILSLIGRISK